VVLLSLTAPQIVGCLQIIAISLLSAKVRVFRISVCLHSLAFRDLWLGFWRGKWLWVVFGWRESEEKCGWW